MATVRCPRCPAQWTGYKVEHCPACHLTFSATKPGDAHRVGSHEHGERRCLSLDEMLTATTRAGAPRFMATPNKSGTLVWSFDRERTWKGPGSIPILSGISTTVEGIPGVPLPL